MLEASNHFVSTNTPPLSPEVLPVDEAVHDLPVVPQEPAGVLPNVVVAQKRGRKDDESEPKEAKLPGLSQETTIKCDHQH